MTNDGKDPADSPCEGFLEVPGTQECRRTPRTRGSAVLLFFLERESGLCSLYETLEVFLVPDRHEQGAGGGHQNDGNRRAEGDQQDRAETHLSIFSCIQVITTRMSSRNTGSKATFM